MTLSWPQRLAIHAAERRTRAIRRPLPGPQRISYSAAMAEAPRQARLRTVELELEYRKLFADELVRMGVARPLGKQGNGKSGKSGESTLPRKTLRATAEEFARQEDEAREAGMAWNSWALERLGR